MKGGARIRRGDGKRLFCTEHGLTGSPTHITWTSMLQRCGPASTKRRYYADRGVTVCERWLTFTNFLADMGMRPEGMTLERIDNSKGYAPDNCRWASRYDQSVNRQSNVWVEWQGQRLTVKQLAQATGHNYYKFRSRLLLGWSIERAVNTP